jgi:uncharacterized surface protein with fasciclin (FAS1) repeats
MPDMLKRLPILLTVAALTVSAAACGDEEESAAVASPPSAETMPEPAMATKDIVALAQGDEQLSTLVKAVTAADLAPTLQGEGPYTVFAPTNEAFAALPEGTLDDLLAPAGKEQLTDILTYHVVEGEVMASDLTDGQVIKTVQGGELKVAIDGGTVTIGDATVVQPDVDASNGVVHVIDTVLQPEA